MGVGSRLTRGEVAPVTCAAEGGGGRQRGREIQSAGRRCPPSPVLLPRAPPAPSAPPAATRAPLTLEASPSRLTPTPAAALRAGRLAVAARSAEKGCRGCAGAPDREGDRAVGHASRRVQVDAAQARAALVAQPAPAWSAGGGGAIVVATLSACYGMVCMCITTDEGPRLWRRLVQQPEGRGLLTVYWRAGGLEKGWVGERRRPQHAGSMPVLAGVHAGSRELARARMQNLSGYAVFGRKGARAPAPAGAPPPGLGQGSRRQSGCLA
jgi:hypothetical protein